MIDAADRTIVLAQRTTPLAVCCGAGFGVFASLLGLGWRVGGFLSPSGSVAGVRVVQDVFAVVWVVFVEMEAEGGLLCVPEPRAVV